MRAKNIALLSILASASATATGNGTAADVTAFEGDVKLSLDSGAGAGTNPTLDVKLQDSPDGSTDWQDVTGASFTQVTDAAATFESITVKADGLRKFVRGVETITGTSPQFERSLVMIGEHKYS